MNQPLAHIYRALRSTAPFYPASLAIAFARSSQALAERVEETGFNWGPNGNCATWSQDDFHLVARIATDLDDWSVLGDHIGVFSSEWKPGAIRHQQDNTQSHDWFIPASFEDPHWNYQRACEYGESWSFVGVMVSAFRSGIELGEAALWGIESDSGQEFLTSTAFELADEAISNAHSSLLQLCGPH